MQPLSTELRRQLERTVIEARDIAETGAVAALEALAVHHHEPYSHMPPEQRQLRRRLRAHARHLGDRVEADSRKHTIEHLVQECAYEHWHGMLFARFLAENHLLIEPESGVAITLEECEKLAKEANSDAQQNKWALAASFAHHMLPQIFRPDHPVFEVQLAHEHRRKLEDLLEELPADTFTATDSLGWVYQFWQAKKKDEVNRYEVKIGADELPAVTQLFTEAYMVQFLLHNSLGAWWISRHPDMPSPVDLSYLRQTEDGTPAAGSFEGWPDDLSEFRLLDPCCGSGHFLVAAFLMLVPMRMKLEGLDAIEAVDAVLQQNIHGLELDQRCVAIAAFALALEAWRYPDAGGYRALPLKFNVAWCGQPVTGKQEDWLALAEGDKQLEAGMEALYETFRDAPTLGSLINPARSVSSDMFTASFDKLQPLLEKAIENHTNEPEWKETAIAALGLAEATRLLNSQYHLVITNVPYLTRRKQSERLRKFAEAQYQIAKDDLANVFLERCLEFSLDEGVGVTQIVMPQNWLSQMSYKQQREHLLGTMCWRLLVRLGPGAFETISGEVVKVILLTLTRARPHDESQINCMDAGMQLSASEKSEALRTGASVAVSQSSQINNPDSRVTMNDNRGASLLEEYAQALQGISPADAPHYGRCFWEVHVLNDEWHCWQSTMAETKHYGGKSQILWFGKKFKEAVANKSAYIRGAEAWAKQGVVVQQMQELPSALFGGDKFDTNCATVIPHKQEHMAAIWCFCSSPQYNKAIRNLDQKMNVTNATLVKVPFDVDHWSRVATESYPNGLPLPYSDDPTQWVFHGQPFGSVVWDKKKKWTACGAFRTDATVLQVAVARLLGYRWPAESDSEMELADEQRAWMEKAKSLYPYEDKDGIACIPSVRGEGPADERLLQLLQAAWGDGWSDGILNKLLAESGSATLEDWLRNKFFEEHCKLFHHRPFIWHIWDGRKRDGFHALVNYHKLAEGDDKGRQLLESLTYSYLGDWISRQQDAVNRGEDGADGRLQAAQELQSRLASILEGEQPYDIFVRWKPIEEQPIGWEPDINDGVRLNIRPFMVEDIPGGKKGAGILRHKPNIHWSKDRGKEPMRDQEQYPWFWHNGEFISERHNDWHFTIGEKSEARKAAGGTQL